MKKKIFFTFLYVLAVNHICNSQTIDEVKKECAGIGILAKANLSVAPFFVSASYFNSGLGNEIAGKIISNLSAINCFTTYNTPASLIPEGTQAVITGDFTDYFTSEGQLGQPRIAFDLEIRNSTTQEIIAKKNFKYIGKVYVGFGKNKPLETIWNKSMDDVAIFLYQNFKLIALQSKAMVEKTKVGETIITNEQTVRRKSILEQMEDYSDKKRVEGKKNSLGIEEYYNDTSVYKDLTETHGYRYIEYTINGQKVKCTDNIGDEFTITSTTGFESFTYAKNGFYVQLAPINFPWIIFDMTTPKKYPTIRRFHFGSDSTYDKKVPSGHVKFTVNAKLFSKPVKNSLRLYAFPKETYEIFATTDPELTKYNNVENGYFQILYFEPGKFGSFEAIFKFKTKSYKNDEGVTIPPLNVEGRFRIRN